LRERERERGDTWESDRLGGREKVTQQESKGKRETEKNKSRSQDLKLAEVNVASLASRISCRRRRPPAPTNTGH
jgi:hypothetical protein